MNASNKKSRTRTVAKIAATLWGLWGVLHVWVAGEGLRLYPAGARALWGMLIGGANAPRDAFLHTTDTLTANVHAHLLLNFCLDVGGYGLLGLAIGWALWKRPAWGWPAYLLGLVVIGLGDLSFLLLQVTPGIVELSLATVSGPALWFVAVAVTPFGLLRSRDAVQ